jgi:hypothetical protein
MHLLGVTRHRSNTVKLLMFPHGGERCSFTARLHLVGPRQRPRKNRCMSERTPHCSDPDLASSPSAAVYRES